MSVVAEIARAVDAACARIGARWFLFGAQAAILRGVVRSTEDVDFTVDLGSASTEELVAALADHGLALRFTDAGEFIAATRVLPLRHEASSIPVDVVLAGSFFEERFFDAVESVAVAGVMIRVPALEDLVVMKVLAGRPTDIEDVVAMLVANPAHDAARIRATLQELEAAIDVSDLVPAFDAAEKRAARARARR